MLGPSRSQACCCAIRPGNQPGVYQADFPCGGSNNPTSEFMNLLDTNAVDIDQAPFATFDYNETKGGVDDHGCEDDLAEIEAEAYEQSDYDKIAQHRYKDMEASEEENGRVGPPVLQFRICFLCSIWWQCR
ncbi:hypothetical protein D1007_55913 [Hordeum vulgare]|nr:hypothetical protein D1007_55913 [Hordeum vulgare]